MDWTQVEQVASRQRFGKVYLELTIHENAVTGAHISGAVNSKKYFNNDNVNQGKDILRLIRSVQDTNYTGQVSLALTCRNGIVEHITRNDIDTIKADVPRKN